MSLVVAVGAGVGIGAGQLFFHRGRGRGRGIYRSRRVRLFKTRAALVESRPRIVPTAVTVRDDNNSNSDNAQLIYRKGLDRAEDIQAEARAMARAANATVYSPQLLALKYNSRPIKVFFNFIDYVVYNVLILCDFWL